MKIALFTDTYLPQTNGVVAYLCDIIGALSKEHEVVLFAPGEGDFFHERVSKNFSIYWMPSSPFPFYESYRVASMDYRRVSALISKEKPDIIHAHAPINLGLQGMIAGKRKRLPVVATYHTHYPDYVPHLLNGKLPSIFGKVGHLTAKKFVKHTFGMADIVTAPTRELASELRSYGMKNVVPLQNGICLKKLRCTAKEAAHFRKTYSIPRGRRTVIYLGRISFEKRLDKLLEAYGMIEDDGKLLIIAGGGPYLEKFKALSSSLGIRNIVFTGYVKRPAIAYSVADVFASASDSETFGLTFVEAMHMGLPAIGVRKLGAKEVITDKKDGLLVEPGDTKALAQAIRRLLEDKGLCSALAREGRKTARRFSIENSMEETIRIYEKLLKSR
ncbi:MAG: glycosyltransferase [Candidatus Micrarchaeota archaeon]